MIRLPISYLGSCLDTNWNTYVNLLERTDDLYDILPNHIENLYLDFETTSEDPDKKSINPHRDCKLLGIAFLIDNDPIPYYIPLRHAYLDDNDEYQYRTGYCENLQLDLVYTWLKELFKRTRKWWNHNIKYDLNALYNETGYWPRCELKCTLVLSKLADFEERFSYDLTEVMQLNGIDISPYELKIKEFLGKKLKDYGLIAPDAMAIYAAVDVLSVRYLKHILDTKLSKECNRITQIEMDLLPVLMQMEQTGLKINIDTLKRDIEVKLPKQVERIRKIKELAGISYFDPSKNESIRELFCDVLGWEMDLTETSIEKLRTGEITEDEVTYSFGYASLMKHRNKNPMLVDTYIAYQEDQKLLTSFTLPYLEEHTSSDFLIHPTINQLVRTGRMSCLQPNMQQLSPDAKEYIIPYLDNYILVEFDLSQIEFRVIVHYIANQKAIEAYRNDPSTDFHTWVSEMCGIPRKPAKNVNFMLGYGGGKKKCVAMLAEHPDIIQELTTKDLIVMRANDVYRKYHEMLPELKRTSYRCSDVLRSRGYVRTLLGRRRWIKKEFHYKSFNAVCQGSAADIQKLITLRLRKFFSPSCILHMCVHDSWIFSIRKDIVYDIIPEILFEIERPIEGVNFDVPIKSGVDCSEKNWRLCDKDQRKLFNEPSYMEFKA